MGNDGFCNIIILPAYTEMSITYLVYLFYFMSVWKWPLERAINVWNDLKFTYISLTFLQSVNEDSLKRLNSYLEDIQMKKPVHPTHLMFYLKNDTATSLEEGDFYYY